jgi:hypothetical protein
VVKVVDDAREAGEVLPGGADEGCPRSVVAYFFPHLVLAIGHLEPPELRGVPEFGLPVADPEPEGLLGGALEDDLVEACVLELGRPVASGVGLAEASGEGGLASHCVPAAP